MIKFFDLEEINNRFRNEIDTRIKNILDKGCYLLGDENKIFEKNFAEYVVVKHCIGCTNILSSFIK